ncbi:hypothetical protein [Acinetobacter venetianus]|uniref:hypothetical protein n=1 Tax=Acinetobacter venetianus TaxID=52133 RepID=UPI0021503C6E|nr:hypothetical protein [Acinetobacter venetianus]MCR4531081.1 hypothetical protein [Acinetobacter venetianus]MDA0696346.1 hypothetical protein [Pseudomonadota bacterium]MDA1255386.1 hypothetical protein [Pseudomonadota bacterium]
MKNIQIKVKDQFETENVAIALISKVNDLEIPLFKRIEHIEIEGEILRPNMELLYESPKDGRIYRFIDIVHSN